METSTKDICIILDYMITESTHTQNGQFIKNHYNIRTNSGEIVSRDYDSLREPIKLLHELATYLDGTSHE